MKKIFPIAIVCIVLVITVAVCLFILLQKPNYESYYTEKNLLDTVKAGENELSAYYFLIEDGTAVLDLCNSDKKVIQRLEFPLQNEYYASLDYADSFNLSYFKDLNFDGAIDLYVACSVTTENCQGMAWLWDSEKDKFVLSEELSVLPTIEINENDKTIQSTDRSLPDFPTTVYKWKNGKLVEAE